MGLASITLFFVFVFLNTVMNFLQYVTKTATMPRSFINTVTLLSRMQILVIKSINRVQQVLNLSCVFFY